jgi:hypothetical protein
VGGARYPRLVVRVDGRRVADVPLAGRHVTLRVSLPPRELTLSVTAVRVDGRSATSRVAQVFGLPQASSPAVRPARLDAALGRRVRQLADGFDGTCAIYVEDLAGGSGAAWNARARFPAASTLKLAIAVAALARDDSRPGPGTQLDSLQRRLSEDSDNVAADDLEVWLAGSTSAGGGRVDELMAQLGLGDSLMYGGYERDPAAVGPIPLRVDEQPSLGRGKYTSAHDLGVLLRDVWLASRGLGPQRARERFFSGSDARHLLYLLAHVHDSGKLDREVGRIGAVRVLHKAGWIATVRHDNGLVFWRGGVFLVTVLTYRISGAGVSSDVLAGRVAKVALARFSSVASTRPRSSSRG